MTCLGPPLVGPGEGALQAPHHARLTRRTPVAERVLHVLVTAQHQQACLLQDADVRMQADLVLSTQQLDRPATCSPVLWPALVVAIPPIE
eukprot:664546-Alexandrium_andersonii.AAC.1